MRELYAYLDQIFEWDAAKARRNWIRHRVYFTEAATVFFDRDVCIFSDAEHSIEEQRYTVIGHSAKLRTLLVITVYREETVRLISARKATREERRLYESELGRRLRDAGAD